MNVRNGDIGFRIEGMVTLNDATEKAVCVLRESGKKEFSVDGELYTRFSKHIGRYPCVVIAPDDIQLIIGASEERRGFLDTIISQIDAVYLQSLINYTKILQQRNSFLRNMYDGFGKDMSVLDVLDEQLAKEGNLIFRKRQEFAGRFLPMAMKLYHEIAQRSEEISLTYDTEMLEISMDDLLKLNRQKDLLVQRTSGGIHKDDLLFHLKTRAFKSIASQGQRKSLLFALKLAEVEIIKREKTVSPLLLLDDVFEKLDEERINNLLQRVSSDENMQIFITDTNCLRLRNELDKLNNPFEIITL